jgi:lysophospholipase L1-like esterase
VSGVFKRAEFSYRISLNDLGMRQKAVSKEKAAGTFRIVALGDSFLWGIGVQSDDERVSEVLQRKLNGVRF